jgi:hypothetical protein
MGGLYNPVAHVQQSLMQFQNQQREREFDQLRRRGMEQDFNSQSLMDRERQMRLEAMPGEMKRKAVLDEIEVAWKIDPKGAVDRLNKEFGTSYQYSGSKGDLHFLTKGDGEVVAVNSKDGEIVQGYGKPARKPIEVTAGASLMTPEGKLIGTAPGRPASAGEDLQTFESKERIRAKYRKDSGSGVGTSKADARQTRQLSQVALRSYRARLAAIEDDFNKRKQALKFDDLLKQPKEWTPDLQAEDQALERERTAKKAQAQQDYESEVIGAGGTIETRPTVTNQKPEVPGAISREAALAELRRRGKI